MSIILSKDIQKTEDHPLENMGFEELQKKLSSFWWRIRNLYYIITDEGKRRLFSPNEIQTELFKTLWYMNLILKSRQHGITTGKCVLFLDKCLFASRELPQHAQVIAHTKDKASEIFKSKVLYPYLNLPDMLLSYFQDKQKEQTGSSLRFGHNDSYYSVSISPRSGTPTLLHISELGKICKEAPGKAEEIITGAFPAMHTEYKNAIFSIESTAEGQEGYFYQFSDKAMALAAQVQSGQRTLTSKEFKFFFFPWWKRQSARFDEPVLIPARLNEYFDQLEAKLNIKLSLAQRAWYSVEEEKLGTKMKRENPSTPEEAFEQAIEGAYFKTQLTKAYQDGRIGAYPVNHSIGVRTWWDIGLNDMMCIWFTQDIGGWVNVIDYYENSGEGWEFYAKILAEKQYIYLEHIAPHDISVRVLGQTVEHRWEQAASVGLLFRKVERPQKKIDSINVARSFFSICRFDQSKCEIGLKRLASYRKAYNSMTGAYHDYPVRDESTHGSDAFQTLALGHKESTVAAARIVRVPKVVPGNWSGYI